MSDPTKTSNRAERFMERLRLISNDRGKMAALRRSASPGTARQAWPVIHSLGEDIASVAACTVGGLYAGHPQEARDVSSFGTTCRRIALHEVADHQIPESFERRFRRLLACDSVVDVAAQLKAWVRFAAARGIGVPYESLFWNLLSWNNHSDRIKLEWARGFWPLHKDAVAPNEAQEVNP